MRHLKRQLVCMLFVVGSGAIIMLAPAHALDVPLQIPISGKGAIRVCSGEYCSGIAEYITTVYRWLVGFAALLAVLAFAWGGIQWLISGGESGKIQEARKVIGNALIGLVLALSSYLLLATLNPNLTEFLPLRIVPISPLALELDEVKATVFSSGGGVHRVASMSANLTTWDTKLAAASTARGVDCTLLKAIMLQESGGNPGDISPAGAVGLMQVMPGEKIAGRPATSALLDPDKNIDYGASYLNGLAGTACNNRGTSKGCDVMPLSGSLATIDRVRVQSDTAYARAIEFVAAGYNAGPGHNQYSAEPSCAGLMRWECPKNERLYKETLPYTKRIVENFLELKTKGWGC